jgi:hypothetical protein
MQNENKFGSLFKIATCAVLALLLATSASASNYPNTLTFSNLSGKGAFVKLIGALRMTISVPNGMQTTVNVPAGTYHFFVQYCDTYGQCTYAQGDPFEVIQTPTQYSVITITLHTVINGNYHERPASRDEFEQN